MDDSTRVHPRAVTPDTAPDSVSAAVAALIDHDKTCSYCATAMPGDPKCTVRVDLAAARRRALRGGAPGQPRPVCPKCGTAGCLEDKALDW